MSLGRLAAIVYTFISAGVVAFQLALALGAPWGAYAMGGAFPGSYPPPMRVAALLLAMVPALLAGVVLSRAGIALPGWTRLSRRLIWVVVAVGAVAFLLNLVTPSAGERAIWAPTALLLLLSSLVVAIRSSSLEGGDR
jgi:hypothetical protein